MAVRYAAPLRLLHWTTALLVAVQFLLAAINAAVYENRPLVAEAIVQLHLFVGVMVLALTLVRLAVRVSVSAPGLPDGMSRIAAVAARCSHAALYGLLLALPVTGYLRLAALGFEIELIGLVPLPAMVPDPALALRAADYHGLLSLALAGLLVVHVLAAFLHRVLFGSSVLHRMAPGGRTTRSD